jgi:hypothetical protein
MCDRSGLILLVLESLLLLEHAVNVGIVKHGHVFPSMLITLGRFGALEAGEKIEEYDFPCSRKESKMRDLAWLGAVYYLYLLTFDWVK